MGPRVIVKNSCDLLSIVLHPHAIQCFIQHDDHRQDYARIREIISTLLPTFWEFLE
jgi:hypothetical protein